MFIFLCLNFYEMAEVIKMPRLSDTMEEGNIVGWMKKVGDKVAPGDILAEVETDKATMELESFETGVLLHIGVESGAVPVDTVIAIIGKKGEDVKAILADIEKSSNGQEKKEEPAVIEPTKPAPAEIAPPAPAVVQQATTTTSSNDQRLKASPLAKKLALEANVSLSNIQGSGDGGRIIKRDVSSFLASGGSTNLSNNTQLSPAVSNPTFEYGDVAISQMRKTIARRLSESKFGAPHFYLTMEINMDAAMEARAQMNEGEEIRISYNDMMVKACASALRAYPAVNCSWLENKISYHEQINIGVAVAVDDGLLVPVIKDADRKSLNIIWKEIREKAGQAKSKKLALDDMQGNTFTISNLGMFDITEFTAIINPPDACILAVGSIIEKPIVKNGEIVVGNTMKVCLSCDHRAVDGATGAKFLQTLKEYLENPMKLLR